MLEPKMALTLLALIFITTCQSFENHDPDSNPEGSLEANLQTWKFKDGYLINKQLGKKYSYGNITLSLEPPGSKSYFHIVQTTNSICKTVSNVSCIFPYIAAVDGYTYSTCQAEKWNDWKPWCPTKLDAYGVYKFDPNEPNTWGNCSLECPCEYNDKILSTVVWNSRNNDKVVLRCNDDERTREWDKIYEGKDGWIKLRHYWSGKVLQLSPDGEHLSVSHNLKPCHGQKPCLR